MVKQQPFYEMRIYSYLTENTKVIAAQPVAKCLTDDGALDLELMMKSIPITLKIYITIAKTALSKKTLD